jgi:hypothetical protein
MKAIDYWDEYIDHVGECDVCGDWDCVKAQELYIAFAKAEKRELICR